uniref:Receptor expression-enhancing protein n=1 Tax=Rhizochromulina marina TaxID=1034831 RepID=A0A7S2SB95_9STRA
MASDGSEKSAAATPSSDPVAVAVPDFMQGLLKEVDGVVASLPPSVQDILTKGSEQTKVQKSVLALGVALLPVLLVLYFLGGADLLVNLVGFLWPAMQSFKAIEAKTDEGARRWLSYWVVYGSLSIVETLLFFVVNMIPYYPLAKMAFLIYCYHPKLNGAGMIYDKVLKPFVVSKLVKTHSE